MGFIIIKENIKLTYILLGLRHDIISIAIATILPTTAIKKTIASIVMDNSLPYCLQV